MCMYEYAHCISMYPCIISSYVFEGYHYPIIIPLYSQYII